MANTISLTKNTDGSVSFLCSGEEEIVIASPIQLFVDNNSISFRVESEVRVMKLSDSITIGGVLFSGTLSQLKTSVENILPGSAPATALPTETVATYAAMQTSITADPTTKRDFFVSADETNGYQLTKYSYDGSSVTRLSKSYVQNNAYKNACLLGDSITGQHVFPTGGVAIQGSQGFWNWGNWLIGAPFHFTQNLGVSGDVAQSIFSRIWQIHSHIDTVFILAGTNDILNFSSTSNSTQISTEIDRLIGTNGVFPLGLSQLKTAGKRVCIATIPPNNAYSSSTDARIQVLDAVNNWILASKTAGGVDEVIDLFTACWDSTLSTTRVFKTNYSTDGTHFTNRAGLAGGQTAITAMKSMYSKAESVSTKFHGKQNQLSLVGQMRAYTSGTSQISYGSGSLANGWRSLNNGTGTPTLVLSNATSYSMATDYIGPFAKIVGIDEKWQKLTITGAVAGSDIRLQLQTALAANGNPGIAYGDEFFVGVDVYLESHTTVKSIYIQGNAAIVSGTSPADQPYGSSTSQARTTSGLSSVSATDYAFQSGFRAHLISEAIRIPENVNGASAVSAQVYLDVMFDGAGDAVVYFARPQFWRKIY
jgi:lysophospholipase L1-like esterase